ncbi:MAG: hypothetical protein ACD_15C00165G0005 [uncultured bacterium]|nr:MAG: hypothetical protein ACD_15C00165G0005 [uncultured bacterium]HCU70344.1 hypothetical protein [Candidatus Moranbacteria bacterium]
MKNEEKIIDDFMKSVLADSQKTKQLFAIGFIGLIGSGKSCVAQKISQKLGLYVASGDGIRRFLDKNGITGERIVTRLMKRIGENFFHYLCQNNVSSIIDVDMIKHYDFFKDESEKFGAKLFVVKIDCPEEIILERIEKRSKDNELGKGANLSRAGKKEYFKRKKLHETASLPKIFFNINTEKDVDEQIDGLILKLKDKNLF